MAKSDSSDSSGNILMNMTFWTSVTGDNIVYYKCKKKWVIMIKPLFLHLLSL